MPPKSSCLFAHKASCVPFSSPEDGILLDAERAPVWTIPQESVQKHVLWGASCQFPFNLWFSPGTLSHGMLTLSQCNFAPVKTRQLPFLIILMILVVVLGGRISFASFMIAWLLSSVTSFCIPFCSILLKVLRVSGGAINPRSGFNDHSKPACNMSVNWTRKPMGTRPFLP